VTFDRPFKRATELFSTLNIPCFLLPNLDSLEAVSDRCSFGVETYVFAGRIWLIMQINAALPDPPSISACHTKAQKRISVFEYQDRTDDLREEREGVG
jgi:hypothetical protein